MQARLIGTDEEVYTYLFPYFEKAISKARERKTESNAQHLECALKKAIEHSPKFRDRDTQRVYRQVFLDDFRKLFYDAFTQVGGNFPLPRPTPPVVPSPPQPKNDYSNLYTRGRAQETIQEYVKRLIEQLNRLNWYTSELLEQLQDKEYCKRYFGITYAVLNRECYYSGVNNTYRYYVHPIKILGQYYYICSQWDINKYDMLIGNIHRWVRILIAQHAPVSNPPAMLSQPPVPEPKNYNDLFINEDETVQEYIRRIVYELKRLNWYTSELLELLQNEAYCKRTFEINFPLLNQTCVRTGTNGTYRYYVNPIEILGKNYYVCSQWWVNYHDFVPLLNEWIKDLIQKNTNVTVKPAATKPTDYRRPIFPTPVFGANASAPTRGKKDYAPQVVRVSLSSYVTVQYVDSGDEDSFLVMSESHIIAGDSGSHIISENSPLGEALMGGREGCLATVYPHTIDNKPNPPYQVRILRIEKWKN